MVYYSIGTMDSLFEIVVGILVSFTKSFIINTLVITVFLHFPLIGSPISHSLDISYEISLGCDGIIPVLFESKVATQLPAYVPVQFYSAVKSYICGKNCTVLFLPHTYNLPA